MFTEFIRNNKYALLLVVIIVVFGVIYYGYTEYFKVDTSDNDSDAGLCRESCSHCRRNCPFRRYNRTCECSYCDNNKCSF